MAAKSPCLSCLTSQNLTKKCPQSVSIRRGSVAVFLSKRYQQKEILHETKTCSVSLFVKHTNEEPSRIGTVVRRMEKRVQARSHLIFHV